LTPAGQACPEKVRGELGIDTMAEDIAALLDNLGIAGKVALAVLPSVERLRFISPPATLSAQSAVAVGSPATGIAPDRRAAALERIAKVEAAGMAFAVEDSMRNGYAPELRGDAKRFERYRAPMARQRSRELCDDLSNVGKHGYAGRTDQAALSRARDRRQPGSRATAAARGKPWPRPSPTHATSKSAPGALYGGANARPHLRLHRRVPDNGGA